MERDGSLVRFFESSDQLFFSIRTLPDFSGRFRTFKAADGIRVLESFKRRPHILIMFFFFFFIVKWLSSGSLIIITVRFTTHNDDRPVSRVSSRATKTTFCRGQTRVRRVVYYSNDDGSFREGENRLPSSENKGKMIFRTRNRLCRTRAVQCRR